MYYILHYILIILQVHYIFLLFFVLLFSICYVFLIDTVSKTAEWECSSLDEHADQLTGDVTSFLKPAEEIPIPYWDIHVVVCTM